MTGVMIRQKPDLNDPVLRERLALLRAAEAWSRDCHQAHQLDALRRTLAHAAAHVPYYRRLFAEAGFDPAGVTSLSDLARLPRLD